MNDDTPTDDRTRPTGDDEGKDVIDASGERIGEVSGLQGDTIVVDADPSLTDQIKSALGWGDADDIYRIDEGRIDRVTDNAVHLETTEEQEPEGVETMSDTGSDPSGVREDRSTDDGTSSADAGMNEDTTAPGETTVGDEPTTETTDEGLTDDTSTDDDVKGITDDELREAGQDERDEGVPDDERRLTDDDVDDDSDDGLLGDDDSDDSDEGVLSDDDDRGESGTR